MEYEDQQCIGLFLLEHKRHREKLSKDNSASTQAQPHRTITTFFSPIIPTNAISKSTDTQMGFQPGHNKGVAIDFLFLFTLFAKLHLLWFCSQRPDNILRCNLWFGLIGHFGLLKRN